MISWIAQLCQVLLWAPCRSSWPSLTWQKPDLVAMFLHCVPLLQPGPAIMKIDDQRGLEEVCGAQGRRERGRCL